MAHSTLKSIGKSMTAGTLCSIMTLNVAMYGCSGAPEGDVVDVTDAPTAPDSGDSEAADALSLDQLVSKLAYDKNGVSYETKFEALGRQLLRKEAKSEEGFHKVLATAFGANYDRAKGEEVRQQILSGDFSWAPQVEIVSEKLLNGTIGAYAAERGVVYLSADATSKFQRTFIYLEELGHHLDTMLNGSDAPGDEGALFRVALTHEAVPLDVLDQMKTDNHAGTMLINGQRVDVEFFFLTDWISAAANAAWNGLKAGANYIWKGATTAGNAIRIAAGKVWDGAATLATMIARGADYAADLFVDFLKREFWAAYQAVNGAVNVLLTAGYGTLEALKVMQGGLTEIWNGNFLDGTAAIFTGLAKLAVEVPLDTVTTAVLDGIGALQTALYLEPVGRYLNQDETNTLSWIFGGQWWLSYVRIKQGWAGIFSVIADAAFTNQFTIYLKDRAYTQVRFVHESAHVWQWANGGGDYKLGSLYEQIFTPSGAYNWESPVNAGKQWEQLNVEQQATFVSSAFDKGCYNYENYDFSVWAFKYCYIGGDRTAFFNGVDQKIWAGIGAP